MGWPGGERAGADFLTKLPPVDAHMVQRHMRC